MGESSCASCHPERGAWLGLGTDSGRAIEQPPAPNPAEVTPGSHPGSGSYGRPRVRLGGQALQGTCTSHTHLSLPIHWHSLEATRPWTAERKEGHLQKQLCFLCFVKGNLKNLSKPQLP